MGMPGHLQDRAAEGVGVLGVMGDQQRRAPGEQGAGEVDGPPPGVGVQPLEGLVQQHQRGGIEQRPGEGFREILQTGLECIGDIDLYQTGEVILLAVRSLATIGEKYILDISHMGFLAALLSESGADEETQAALLRCVGEKNPHGIAEICRSAAIPDAYAERIARAASLYGSIEEVLPLLRQLSDSAAAQAALDELDGLRGILRAAGCEQNVHLDLSIVHDMDYYNGIIMSGYLAGIPRAVLSGGRYDRLLRKMGKSGGAMGFALYLDLLERYGEESREYDADILLLYDSTTDPQTLTRTVEMLCEGGRSVRTQTCVPDGFRYGRLLSVKNGRLETLDEK